MRGTTYSFDRTKTGFVQIFRSKIQDFFQTFLPKTIVYFFRFKVTKWVVNRDLEKRGNNLFSRCTANVSNHGTMWTNESYETSHSVIKCLGYGRD